jgi:hypothetical protein
MSICCGGMGLNEGIYSKDEWDAACCGAMDCNQLMAADAGCFNWKCDASSWNPTGWGDDESSQCVEDKQSVKVGASCGGDKSGCFECLPDGNCDVPQAKVDSKASCGPSDSCKQSYCTADGCTGSDNINEGKPCTLYALDADCADTACKAGVCVSTATGKPCTTKEKCPEPQTGIITFTGTCRGVACIGKQVVSSTCQTPPGQQTCESKGCTTGTDGQCCGGACKPC